MKNEQNQKGALEEIGLGAHQNLQLWGSCEASSKQRLLAASHAHIDSKKYNLTDAVMP